MPALNFIETAFRAKYTRNEWRSCPLFSMLVPPDPSSSSEAADQLSALLGRLQGLKVKYDRKFPYVLLIVQYD